VHLSGPEGERSGELGAEAQGALRGSCALLRAALEPGSAVSAQRASELALRVAAELREAVSVQEEKLQRLEPQVWREFSREIGPYYVSAITPSSPEHSGVKRFEKALKPVYELIRTELLEGRHRKNCQAVLGSLVEGELRRTVSEAFPGLEGVAERAALRSDLEPGVVAALQAAVERACGARHEPDWRSLSDAEKMMASGYLGMPALRGEFRSDDVSLKLVELRPSVPPFPGQGRYPQLSESAPPLPSAAVFNSQRELGELYARLPEETRERVSEAHYARHARRRHVLSPQR